MDRHLRSLPCTQTATRDFQGNPIIHQQAHEIQRRSDVIRPNERQFWFVAGHVVDSPPPARGCSEGTADPWRESREARPPV
jgi:hypothetical protein